MCEIESHDIESDFDIFSYLSLLTPALNYFP